MSYISNFIDSLNKRNRKALSIFLTAGFPEKNNFVDLAKSVLDSGADLLELGIPFSDPLADGHVIQAASKSALDSGVNTKDVLNYAEQISMYSSKPIILMGYANPIKKYGVENFLIDAANSGAKGLIVPDVPLEEYNSFFNSNSQSERSRGLDIILLTTPTSSEERIKRIDAASSGFVYCVSITGTTGVKNTFDDSVIANIKRTYSLLEKNKMMIGFGISKPEDVKRFSPFCNGVIVGSRVMKSLLMKEERNETLKIIEQLSESCK
ncbi:MAG: tryptophan synthase alpha subunit [Ignavibacteria bacterium]|nr:MAG: tryptophan synthase alpha subunit [Ignavibacteria bacterium]KAF0161978.1 MAG: tryptophan synthase alpha subunit [Ignavibacteria bacterium]